MSWKALGALIGLGLAVPAHAQSVEGFYRNRTITILVGFTAGGGYDLYARLLGRHMGRHVLGNPTILVQNMPGAGSLNATQFVYSVAPKDGTVLATVSRGMVTCARVTRMPTSYFNLSGRTAIADDNGENLPPLSMPCRRRSEWPRILPGTSARVRRLGSCH
jgi:tripartite-type tricarboxylate transporter receptor subunit TctC